MERDFDPAEAEHLLAEMGRLRQQTQKSVLTANWWMLLMWGAIFLLSVPALVSSSDALSMYWVVAGPAGGIASFAVGTRRDREVSTGGSVWPYLVTAVLMFTIGFGVWFVLADAIAILVWWLALVAGFGSFAALDGQRLLVAALAFIAAWGVGMYFMLPDDVTLYVALASTAGSVLVGTGVGLWMVRR
ncbi:MAG: hypothetical protein HKN46_11045 [Acidimicrobiia bacterium]|nr:hypothetical protein [Acidimicrobiia bacterium]